MLNLQDLSGPDSKIPLQQWLLLFQRVLGAEVDDKMAIDWFTAKITYNSEVHTWWQDLDNIV